MYKVETCIADLRYLRLFHANTCSLNILVCTLVLKTRFIVFNFWGFFFQNKNLSFVSILIANSTESRYNWINLLAFLAHFGVESNHEFICFARYCCWWWCLLTALLIRDFIIFKDEKYYASPPLARIIYHVIIWNTYMKHFWNH